MKVKGGRLLMISILLLLIPSIPLLQISISSDRREMPEERLRYIPSGRYLRLLSAGYHTLTADLIWSWSVISFNKHLRGEGDFTWLPNALEAITTLDPLFRDAYLYGGIMLAMGAGNPEEAVKLLEKGTGKLPDDWQLHFFLGFYRLFFRIDPLEGIAHLEKAASLPGRPSYLPVLVAKAYTKLGRLELAIRYLEQTKKLIKDRGLRMKIESQLAELLKRGPAS